jgi:hypothetical protein
LDSAKRDAELLMNEAIVLAKRMLASDGEFYPYAFAIRPNNEIISIAAQIEHENFPSPLN